MTLSETWHKKEDGSIKDVLGMLPEWRDRTHKVKGGGVAILFGPNVKAVYKPELSRACKIEPWKRKLTDSD